MALEDRIEHPADPSAAKVLDRNKCIRMIRTAPSHARFPLGDVLKDMADQLQLAIAELETVSTSINNARNETTRYQHEAANANAEVKTMQGLLVTARDEREAALKELQALKDSIADAKKAAVEPPPPKKRGRPAKVVPIGEPQQKAAQ